MRVGLVITTYERPDALAAVLASASRQVTAPDEIIIADDGSGAETRALMVAFAAHSPVPVRIVSQPHQGFRLTRLRNLAIAAARVDYLIFVDGDMLLHPRFVEDHARVARRGYFTQGLRVRADGRLTRRLLAPPHAPPAWWRGGMGLRRRVYLLRSIRLARASLRLANGLIAIKGCNQAFWRDDLVRVNGFNEAIEGWGPEDKELCARLGFAGIARQTLLFGGIAWHLHHPPAARGALPANFAVLSATRVARQARCERGLDAHGPL